MARLRLGVVLLVPEPTRSEIDGLRRACGDVSLALVPPHITLIPPINVRLGDVDDAVAIVREAASATTCVKLTLGPVATFEPNSPVLFLVVGGDVEPLFTLRRDLLSGPLDRPTDWPFVPHVTLTGDAPPARLAAGVDALADFHATIDVERVHVLAQDEPDRVWRRLADARLGSRAVVGRGGLPVELAVSCGLDPEGERFLAHEGSRSASPPADRFAVTARREGSVVGVAEGSVRDDLMVERLIVGAGQQRQGIGSHLLASVELLARQRGCRRCVVVVPVGGPAEMFYRGRGWRSELGLPDWRPREDFVRMVRAVVPVGGDKR